MQATRMKDVVCGMEMDIDQVDSKSEFEGRQYYFCSDECRRKFENNPAQYVEEARGPA